MKKLLFGTAGIPTITDGKTEDGIRTVKELGLGAMELEFVRSVYVKEDKAPNIDKVRKENDIILTCHASYYINLNSAEKEKIEASKHRILSAARILDKCGGWSVCYHPGFYQKFSKEESYGRVKEGIKDVMKQVKSEGLSPWIRTETTGKGTQFGTYTELLKLSAEFDQMMPVIDFSHIHARNNGIYNSYDEFAKILNEIEKYLGKKGLQNMHIHVSGIAYNEKGEKHHLVLKESDMKYKELMKALKDYKCAGVVISESPNIEGDALLMQKAYNSI